MADKINYVEEFIEKLEEKCELDEGAIEILIAYDISLQKLINLVGGIPCNNIDGFLLTAEKSGEATIIVTVFADLYYVDRIIDFSARTIANSSMVVEDKGKHIGTNLFLNQIIEAKTYFNHIYLNASQGANTTGYYHWSKFGFIMDTTSNIEFNKWIAEKGRLDESIRELVLTVDGCKLWKEEGFKWSGYFFLNEENPCLEYLRGFLKKKNIDVYI